MQNLITKEGFSFSFNPLACQDCEGKCCIGESGYIWVNEEEIESIAKFISIDKKEFIDNYLRKIGKRYSIKEIKIGDENYECLFFNKGCSIYQVRPKQCRTYPFWDYFKIDDRELRVECKGIV